MYFKMTQEIILKVALVFVLNLFWLQKCGMIMIDAGFI